MMIDDSLMWGHFKSSNMGLVILLVMPTSCSAHARVVLIHRGQGKERDGNRAARACVQRAHPRAFGAHHSERPALRLEQLQPGALLGGRLADRRSQHAVPAARNTPEVSHNGGIDYVLKPDFLIDRECPAFVYTRIYLFSDLIC